MAFGDKTRDYVEAQRLIDRAVSLMEKHGRFTAQFLMIQLAGRAVKQKVPRKQFQTALMETFDMFTELQGASAEEVVKRLFK